MMALKAPKHVSELRTQLVAFVNYYRGYIPMMSQLLSNMNRLLKKGQPCIWGPAQQTTHDGFKAVSNREGIVLLRIDYDKLHKYLSNNGLGTVLGQLDVDGNEYMRVCISWSLNKHEANYSRYNG